MGPQGRVLRAGGHLSRGSHVEVHFGLARQQANQRLRICLPTGLRKQGGLHPHFALLRPTALAHRREVRAVRVLQGGGTDRGGGKAA